jgi:hypothetical protein
LVPQVGGYSSNEFDLVRGLDCHSTHLSCENALMQAAIDGRAAAAGMNYASNTFGIGLIAISLVVQKGAGQWTAGHALTALIRHIATPMLQPVGEIS